MTRFQPGYEFTDEGPRPRTDPEAQRMRAETEQVEVRVPGAVFYECFDPCATEYPREANLPEPERRRVGKGSQYRYRVSVALGRDMLDHAEIFGEAISFGVDDPRAGRMVVRWVARERERLGWSR